MKKIAWIILFLMVFIVKADDSTTMVYPFKTTEQSSDFQYLTQNLRCLVCANQSLADSNAPLAGDLRQFIYQQIIAGNSREAIKDSVVARYGDYVLYQPPFQANTLLLWLGPLLIVFIGVIACLIYWRNRKPIKLEALTPSESTQLQKILPEDSL